VQRDAEFDDWDPVAERAQAAAAAPKAKAPRVKAPPKSKEERAASRVQAAKDTANTVRRATRQRSTWEKSPEGIARSKDIVDLATDAHNKMVDEHPRGHLLQKSERLGITKAQAYQHLGVTNNGHGHGDAQLPGMENPHAAPQPPRFEDLAPTQQKKVDDNLKLHGTTREKMKNDFGAQFDQSLWRAASAGHFSNHDVTLPVGPSTPGGKSSSITEKRSQPVTFTQHFYGEHPDDAPEPLDRPKEMMRESRAHLASQGIHADPMVHTAAVGHVSPNVKFTQGERGNRTSPNIEAAEAVFQQHAAGVSPVDMNSGKNRRGITNQSRPANSRRAGLMLQHVDSGQPLATARNLPSKSAPQGSTQWGPKTGPFTNSFDAQHPDFAVADVHTGGGAGFPHLGTSKPVKRNAKTGKRSRLKEYQGFPESDDELANKYGERKVFAIEKSGRENAIEKSGSSIPGSQSKKVTFHSAMDHAVRGAVAERGLGSSVRMPQAAQWGEEQIQRKVASPKLDVPSHDDAYPSQAPPLNPNQMKMF
jgi:hypothetical protein